MNFWQNLKKPIMVLAPLADVTDPAFRYIIAKYSKWGGQDIGTYGKFTRPPVGLVGGPDVMWTEFVSADGLFLGGYDHLIKDLTFAEAERPIVAQFFSSKPEMMQEAAELACDLGFDGIDINMGCPDKSVEKQGSGAAHIKDHKQAQEIILATMKGAQKDGKNLPVSVKTRVGYNKNELENWLPALLETNPSVVTIHARTRKEMSNVPAKWQYVAQAVKIRDAFVGSNGKKSQTLIFGNGDVADIDDARRKCEETGCDGVMLGRAIFGNPWLFNREVKRDDVSISDRLRVMVEHTRLFEELLSPRPPLGPGKSFAIMKKHYRAYVNGWDGAKELRMKLMGAKNADEVGEIVENYIKNI